MDALSPIELDAVLHQPIRTRLAAFLMTRGEATFTELKKELSVTDGNLDAHIKKLLAANYLRAQKTEDKTQRTQTIYKLTAKGKGAFENYLETLKRVLSIRL
ncbi:MAG: transcriptional regulator [Gammaproteobacteria bacterium]|nr:transcriptional regulator [Gammaproteobacteria bacterium]